MKPQYFETDALREKGIHRVRVDLSRDGYDKEIDRRNEKMGVVPNCGIADPFRLSAIAEDQNAASGQLLGFLDGVYIDDYNTFGGTVYIFSLYTEPEYQKCGIASQLLELVPDMAGAEFDCKIRVLTVKPFPIMKGEDSEMTGEQNPLMRLLGIPMMISFYSDRGFIPDPNGNMTKFIKGKTKDKWRQILEKLERNGLMDYQTVKDMLHSADMLGLPEEKLYVRPEYHATYTMESTAAVTELLPITDDIINRRHPNTVTYAQISAVLAEYGLSINRVFHDPKRFFLNTYYIDYDRGIYGVLVLHKEFQEANAHKLGEMSSMMASGNRYLQKQDWHRYYQKTVPIPLYIHDFSRRINSFPDDAVFNLWYQLYKHCDYSNGMWSNELLESVFSHSQSTQLPPQNEDGTVTVYRGIGSRSQPPESALSWTVSPPAALWFANHGGNGMQVAIAEVDIDDIIAYYPGARTEYEVILRPGSIRNLRAEDMIPVTSAAVQPLINRASYDFHRFGKQAFRFGYPIVDPSRRTEVVHDVAHILRVLMLALIYYYNSGEALTEQDKAVLIRFALLHDIGRTHEGWDDLHGARSLEVIRQKDFRIGSLQMRKKDFVISDVIIQYHCLPDTAGLEAIAAHPGLNRREKERAAHLFCVCKDLDGLDRVRLFSMESLDYRLLRTPYGRRLSLVAGSLLHHNFLADFNMNV